MAATPEMAALIATEDALLNRSVLVADWPHEAPDRPFTVALAQQAWQRHAACDLDTCARKLAALRKLVEAKLIKPDARIERYL